MADKLNGKIAIVTGASRGIGKAIAIRLGALGASVAVNYAQDKTAAESTVAEIEKSGGRAISIPADMRRINDVQSLFERTIDAFGAVDILVNNAGVRLFKPIIDITEDEFDNIFAVNVKGVFFACQMAARKLADGGRIINISSSVTRALLPNYGTTSGATREDGDVYPPDVGDGVVDIRDLGEMLAQYADDCN